MSPIKETNQLIIPDTKIKFIAKLKNLILKLKNLITNRKFITITFFAIYPILSYIMMETIQGSNILLEIKYIVLNLLFIYSFLLLLYALTNSYKKSIIISNVILYILSLVNYVVSSFRGTPIVPWDILCIGVALNVSSGFKSIPIKAGLIIGTSIFTLVTSLAIRLKYESKKSCKKLAFKLISATAVSVFVICFYTTNMISAFNLTENLWEPLTEYHDNGFIASLLKNSKSLFVSSPEGYSSNKVQEIYDSIQTSSESRSDIKPNIVVIIDESFADLNVLGNLESSEDYLPFLHSLSNSNRVIKGNLHVSVYGGQTPNTEWEFLTGNTMAFMPPRTVPFQQYIYSSTQSLVSTLEAQGYKTSAFHSYYKTGYRRNYVYNFFGFDSFLDIDTLNNLNYLREYPDDRSTFKNIIDLFENKSPDDKLFSYTLTMQNHSGYDYSDYTSKITQSNQKYIKTDQYLSVAHESDTALKELLEYFENYKEPTIVLFFGDHQPNTDSEFFDDMLNSNENPDSKEVQEKKYITPFVIWANYDLNIKDEELKNIDDISLNYLSGVLLKIANLKTTPYMDYLENLRKTIPVITGNGYISNDNKYYNIDDDNSYKNILDDYSFLQYNNVFDKSNKINEIFEIKE